ncbi:MAG: tRNA pseudouridine(38-40) synthase TruA [Saprospiraceae bacterium]|nr:tRNA pseudouridine(38-40) synthase TruA [Saprospiraceae bacterium]
MRHLAYCSFVGTDFVGWQRQPNGMSVQSSIEDAFAIYFRQLTAVVGCGRTDSGVHGKDYAFHFDTDGPIDEAYFLFKVNKLLPRSIVIHRVEGVEDTFHARFSALSRRYIYRIHTEKDPFITAFSWHFDRLRPESLPKLNETAEYISSLKDFASFAKTGSDNKTTLCNMIQCQWKNTNHRLELHIEANRFLRGMVRLIVGSCVNIAVGKQDLTELKELSGQGKMLPYSFSVPAHGLTFEGVRY